MSFLLYKFSQSPIITFISVVYSVFTLLFFGLKIHIVLSILLAIVSFVIIFIPIISLFYPILFVGYMVAAVAIVPKAVSPHYAILVSILILTILRFSFMFVFAKKHPQLSLSYDTYLRSEKK